MKSAARCYYDVMRKNLIERLSAFVAVLSVVAVIGLVSAEIYVRWKVNKDFTFLGGDALPALILGTFVYLLGFSYIHRDTVDK